MLTKQSTNQVGLLTGSRDGAGNLDDMLASQRNHKKEGGHCSGVLFLWLMADLHVYINTTP